MPIKPPKDEARMAQQRFVGRRIRAAREEQGLTRNEISGRIGFGHTWLYGVETGMQGIDAIDLKKIADLLGYPVEYFINPNYDGRQLQKPQTRGDWDNLYPERREVAALHWEIDRKLGGSAPFHLTWPSERLPVAS